MKKKTLSMILALILIGGAVIGVTLAWLTDTTDSVTNVFTTSDINITLDETTGVDYKMIPGHTIEKDPKVTVESGSEPAWLFVKLEKSAKFDDFMTYTPAAGWIQLKDGEADVSGVFYRKVASSDIDQEFDVLVNNEVTVKDEVAKEDMEALTGDTYPKLTVTAYATQFYKDGDTGFTALEAWNIVSTS